MKKLVLSLSLLLAALAGPTFASLEEIETKSDTGKVPVFYDKNREVLKKIQELRQTDKRIGLFIGRTGEERIPGEKDQYEENGTIWASSFPENRGKKKGLPWPADSDEKQFPEDREMVWVSVDLNPGNPPEGRLHLTLDLSKEDQLQSLKHTFHKVVVDISTVKFFCDSVQSDPVEKFTQFLVKDRESRLMFEFYYLTVRDHTIEDPHYNLYNCFLPISGFTSYTRRYREVGNKAWGAFQSLFEKKDEDSLAKQREADTKGLELMRDQKKDTTYETQDLSLSRKAYFRTYILPKALKEANIPAKDPFDEIDHAAVMSNKMKTHTETYFNKVIFHQDQPYYINNYQLRSSYFEAIGPK